MATSPRPPRPRSDRRSRQRQFRRRRLAVLAALASIVVVLVLLVPSGGRTKPKARDAVADRVAKSAQDAPIPAVEAGVLPWSLHAPVSREVVLPGGGGTLLVIGGLTPAGASSPNILSVNVNTGNETVVGVLAAGVHDGAGAVAGGAVTIVGGGSPSATGTIQNFLGSPGAGAADPPPPGWTLGSSPSGTTPVVITGQTTTTTAAVSAHASVVSNLPQARTDHSAITIGSTTYVIGGFDGTGPDLDILATNDGIRYRSVGKLAVAVRYGAVASLEGKIYVFGGQAVGGPADQTATDTVQVFDPRTGQTKIVGALATPLAGSSAFNLQGHLYFAGGVSNTTNASPGSATKLSNVATDAIWAWDPRTNKALPAGKLPIPVAYAGSTVEYGRGWLIGGETQGQPVNSVEMLLPNQGFGFAGAQGAGSPYFGYKLLIADRGNDRLLVLMPGDQPVWSYPSVFAAAPPGGFYFPDDAFFSKGGTEIVSNQERNHTIVIVSFPSGQLLWQYGHPLQPGAGPGYLSWPDDAYVLKDGEVTVADDRNCRILFISPAKAITSQIGTTGNCKHQPPNQIAEPNGDTPLPDGNYLVSEIDGQWISEYTKTGQLVWTTHLNIHYPSDPQQLGPDLYLVSDYAVTPGGAIVEFNREGQILYRLQPVGGLARMNQPSLTELLPSGVFMTNDDYRNRMVAFDPATGAVVWQYGVPDKPGTAPGYLNTPDGFDLLAPDGTTPTHPATG